MNQEFKFVLSLTFFLIVSSHSFSNSRHTLILSGQWEFDQTDKAYPPETFTRKIPVPGLIDLAEPRIDQYEELFYGDHTAKYNWYRITFSVPPECHDKKAVLTLLKSRFNTQVILNDIDLGTYMECSTPIECELTQYLNFKGENTLMIRVDDFRRLPVQSAYSYDVEKFTYISGIWDDVFITFTGPVRITRSLCLPNAKDERVTIKLLLENLDDKIKHEFSLLDYETGISVFIREKKSGNKVSDILKTSAQVKCLNRKQVEMEIPIKDVTLWSPDTPFLYEAVIEVSTQDLKSDKVIDTFGMRDFGSGGKHFVLNKNEITLLGSNITLARFMEDRERANLIWDKKWVKRLLIDIPKALRWNTFRFSIGLAPDFWYDLADEYGIMIQNEWPMWKNRGWDRQIEKEYTDWVWADGSHPSIIIWDAMNESRHPFIGKVLIPRLKIFDPTRIWDAGYMNESNMSLNEMDEPHFYPILFSQRSGKERVKKRRESYRFGSLFYKQPRFARSYHSSVPQLVNEYAWMWLNRDGSAAFISKGKTDPDDKLPQTHYYRALNDFKDDSDRTIGHYEYYLGSNTDTAKNLEFYAYYLQLQTEELRSRAYFSGVMGFSYLTYNRGYTGDWFLNPVKDLIPGPVLKWQFHCFSPFAVFIDEEDGRYLKNPITFTPGEDRIFKLFGINDNAVDKKGTLLVKLMDKDSRVVAKESIDVEIPAHFEKNMAVSLSLPLESGGYLLVTELTDPENITQISRRYIRVGDTGKEVVFPEYGSELLVISY